MGRGISAESRELVQRAYEVLEREHPSGVRRVCYALYGNQADDFVKKLGRQLTRARKMGRIPWEWISDDTRPSIMPYCVEDMNDLRRMKAGCASYNPWKDQGVRVIIWSEKSLGGTLAPLLDSYLVEFQVHHGNTSATEIHDIAEWCREHPTKLLVILYVGDHDPKGLRISEDDVPNRMDGENVINWCVKRIAILREDAEAIAVEDRDGFKEGRADQKDDTDIRWYRARTGLNYGCEVEALSSVVLRARVEAHLKAEIRDVDAWNRVMNASRVVRESWEKYVAQWPALDSI